MCGLFCIGSCLSARGLPKGEEYTDRGQDYFEERYRQLVLHNLTQLAKAMGMQLVPSEHAV